MPIKNIVTGQKVTKEKLERAKELRREMTPAEKILWEQLRANKMGPLRPSGTSPKSDDANSESAFRLVRVGFGGGRWGLSEMGLKIAVSGLWE